MDGQIYLMRCNNYIYVGKHDGDIFKDRYYGSGIAWTNVVNKYGKESVQREILETYSNSGQANALERKYIKEYKITYGKNCLNIADGGQGGNLGPDVVAKLKGKSAWNKGIPMSDEAKKRASNSLRGHPNYNFSDYRPSEEIKKKISKSHIGIRQTEESIKKIRDARLRQTNLVLDSQKGKHWYTNGVSNITCYDGEQPVGYVRGRVFVRGKNYETKSCRD